MPVISPAPLPPALSGRPPFGGSPASMSSGNPGEVAAAVTKVREAIKILQMALPAAPVGSDLHKTLLKCVTDLSKVAPQGEASPGLQQNTLMDLLKQAQQQAPMQAAMRAMASKAGQAAGSPAAPNPAAAAAA